MAEPKKKANTRKTSSRGKNSQNDRWNDTETQADTSFFRAEVIMICTFAVAVFLFCSNFKICGVVGNFFRQLQLGVFGSMGFVFPLLMCLGICFYISNRGNVRAVLKLTGCVFCLLSLCGFMQMLFGGGLVEGQKILQYYLKSGEKGIGGGLFGGLLVIAFGNLLGKLGTYLFLTVIFILGMVFLTEKSFVAFIRKNSARAYQYAKSDVSRRKEEYGQQRAERAEQKKNQENRKVVSGVDLKAATLKPIPLVQQGPVSEESPSVGTETTMPTRRKSFVQAQKSTAAQVTQDAAQTQQNIAAQMPLDAGYAQAEEAQKTLLTQSVEAREDSSADKMDTEKKTEFIFMEDVPEKRDIRMQGEPEPHGRGKVIDFDAVERAARRARLKKETEKAETEEAAKKETEERPLRRADVFVGRINHPFLSASVDEFDDEDVERILAMQKEEKKNFPLSVSEEKPKEEISTYTMDVMDTRRQQNKSQDFVSWRERPQREISRESSGDEGQPYKNRQTAQLSFGWNRKEAGKSWEPMTAESSWKVRETEEQEPFQEQRTDTFHSVEYENFENREIPETGYADSETFDDTKYDDTEQKESVYTTPNQSQVVLEEAPDESFYQDTSGSVFVPEKTKTVVTAGGKIIEAETSLLQKKLEEKKSAAVTGMDTSVQLPDTQRIRSKSYGYESERNAGFSGGMPSYGDDAFGKSRKEFKPRKDEFENAKPAGPTLKEQMKKQEELLRRRTYVFPPDSLLTKGNFKPEAFSEKEYRETAIKLQQTLQNFGVGVTVTDISCGPAVTRYELHPEQGVKVSRIVSLQDDIKLSLAAADIRIEAPIPGKSAVGIEVPNKENSIVRLRDILESSEFKNHPSRLAFAVGKDIAGKVVVTDIAKMPHLLIAGATGSGKSVCINTLIMSILYKASPEEVKLIMVDPKVVELSVYNGIPHLLIPVVTDPKKASAALNWAVVEMNDRYKKFADYNVRDLKGYNAKIDTIADIDDDTKPKKLPQIVIIIDELADLMMVAPGEVEESICRLAQLARAAGIHLVIATQRPSVNVITGLIKANVPSRIAFAVSSGVDSRTIIDMNGAEKLLGKGDMLFYPSGIPKPIRVQGAFVSDAEVTEVVEFLSQQGLTAEYDSNIEAKVAGNGMDGGIADSSEERDAYFAQAGKFIIEKDKASIGMLQRVLKIGFNRAARIMDQLADAGVVGEEEGTKPRKVLMTMEEFEELL
ncbi:MAG: DNA translocase FtsK 4TM domain-containing protein [bacterium]|nr:DNA translocase FtsK 4TM domain-containing protein [bacterium]